MFMKYCCSIYIIVSVFCNTNLYAQETSTSFRNLVKITPISPEAASLGKFGNIPVGYYTGTPQISIPIYDIKVGSIHLPVSLNYHAAGIRVDKTSSSVGIGWALSGSGVVSR